LITTSIDLSDTLFYQLSWSAKKKIWDILSDRHSLKQYARVEDVARRWDNDLALRGWLFMKLLNKEGIETIERKNSTIVVATDRSPDWVFLSRYIPPMERQKRG